MIRFDFDVVSDPLPPRRIAPPAAAGPAGAAAKPQPAPPAEEISAEGDEPGPGQES
jgi:hypothetical protein